MTRTLVLATKNNGKLKEIRELLGGLDYHVVSCAEYSELPEAIEDGTTFHDNAVKKAVHYARLTGEWALADDSGLEVDALDGRPGVYSARYAGDHGNNEANNAKLLAELSAVPQAQRTARFRCVVALCTGETDIVTADGACEGLIGFECRGKNGFGYDPLFIVPEYSQTMAELSPRQKNEISHRGRALQKMRVILETML